ncbi:MAG: hypothetical protein UX80_C0018G0011 [Candidatus Amesbacteria bacterium GW2011_GWA2_47_11b]|uniref:Uncharacterized protein n=2 Tax=Candidatus Amesiibacteriota TaxID=1752730 RepID=A0A0G1SDG2_9BACT|nr:MAG: hypothetical protein UX42_C0018G0009 [Microgenomates group bacterium GW2011_GWC1_46_20]KKU57357.1 MAG: hypothetical protein UX80_C0018G0011 [Candidatus Amesbacteria bacterium GW2011_GWA2_47_11b]KKU67437.1 MAG: hypothetical protein UX92_C0031G0011 [Candidatus Amesbacteria bacterium GW2011_GWA1_47_20]
MSMNTQRITISMPDYLYTQLLAAVPAGQISKFVSISTEKNLLKIKTLSGQVTPLLKLAKKIEKKSGFNNYKNFSEFKKVYRQGLA